MTGNKRKICICIHGNSVVDTEVYANHLAVIASTAPLFETSMKMTKNIRINDARNLFIEELRKTDTEFMVLIDTDHVLPTAMIPMLMQHMDNGYSVASGLIHRRRDQMDGIGFIKAPDGSYRKTLIEPNNMIYDVDTCAFGCTVINLKDAYELPDPIFRDTVITNADGKSFLTHSDTNFCIAMRDRNKKICIDSRVCVGHVVSEPLIVFPQNATKLQDAKKAGVFDRPAGYLNILEKP